MALTKPRASQIYNLDYKQATRVVTVTNITLAGSAPAQVDGVSLTVNDRVLVTGQSTGSQNGIYDVDTVGTGSNGTWSRTSDANSTGEINAGMIVMVTEGAIYADTQWKLITDDPITIGTTALTFTQNYSANSISGGTSNVTVYSNANVTISSAGASNVLTISSTGTITSGTVSVTGNVTVANLYTGGGISAVGDIKGDYLLGNIYYATGFSSNKILNGTSEANIGTVNGNANISIGGTSNVAVFAPSGEYVTGVVSATGNITGNYFIGNGAALTGIVVTAGAQILNGTSNVTVAGSSNVTIGIAGTTIATFASSGEYVTGIISATGNITSSGNINATGNITSSGNINGVNLNSTNADLAELYVADASYESGTVMEFGGNYEITIAQTSHSTTVAGIISTAPGHLMNSSLNKKYALPLALTGRVPCRVVGIIRKGDRLVSSEIPGVATALDMIKYQPGCIIGKALEEYDSIDNGIIEVAVGRF